MEHENTTDIHKLRVIKFDSKTNKREIATEDQYRIHPTGKNAPIKQKIKVEKKTLFDSKVANNDTPLKEDQIYIHQKAKGSTKVPRKVQEERDVMFPRKKIKHNEKVSPTKVKSENFLEPKTSESNKKVLTKKKTSSTHALKRIFMFKTQPPAIKHSSGDAIRKLSKKNHGKADKKPKPKKVKMKTEVNVLFTNSSWKNKAKNKTKTNRKKRNIKALGEANATETDVFGIKKSLHFVNPYLYRQRSFYYNNFVLRRRQKKFDSKNMAHNKSLNVNLSKNNGNDKSQAKINGNDKSQMNSANDTMRENVVKFPIESLTNNDVSSKHKRVTINVVEKPSTNKSKTKLAGTLKSNPPSITDVPKPKAHKNARDLSCPKNNLSIPEANHRNDENSSLHCKDHFTIEHEVEQFKKKQNNTNLTRQPPGRTQAIESIYLHQPNRDTTNFSPSQLPASRTRLKDAIIQIYEGQPMTSPMNIYKHILFSLVVLVWSPCLLTVACCWLVTYPLRPRHKMASNELQPMVTHTPMCKFYRKASNIYDHIVRATNRICPSIIAREDKEYTCSCGQNKFSLANQHPIYYVSDTNVFANQIRKTCRRNRCSRTALNDMIVSAVCNSSDKFNPCNPMFRSDPGPSYPDGHASNEKREPSKQSRSEYKDQFSYGKYRSIIGNESELYPNFIDYEDDSGHQHLTTDAIAERSEINRDQILTTLHTNSESFTCSKVKFPYKTVSQKRFISPIMEPKKSSSKRCPKFHSERSLSCRTCRDNDSALRKKEYTAKAQKFASMGPIIGCKIQRVGGLIDCFAGRKLRTLKRLMFISCAKNVACEVEHNAAKVAATCTDRYLQTMRKRPCMCCYYRWPRCYPTCITWLRFCRNCGTMSLLCITGCIWFPMLFIVAFVMEIFCFVF